MFQVAKSVVFHASWPDPGSYGLIKAREVEFKHGLGPCGRIVTRLSVHIEGQFLKVSQTSVLPGHRWWKDRSEIKEFVYKITDVHGQIVIIE